MAAGTTAGARSTNRRWTVATGPGTLHLLATVCYSSIPARLRGGFKRTDKIQFRSVPGAKTRESTSRNVPYTLGRKAHVKTKRNTRLIILSRSLITYFINVKHCYLLPIY